jgi:S1-C subfamily serine protease
VNLVDLVVVAVVVAALVHGARVGALAQVLGFAGFWVGLVAGSAVAPVLSRQFGSPLAQQLVGLAAPLVGAAVLASVGHRLATGAWSFLRRVRLATVDGAAGSVLAGAASLLSVWLVGFMLAAGPWPAVAREIQRSTILGALDRSLPGPPSVLARIQRLLDRSGFPQVFAGLEPGLGPAVALPGDPGVRAAVERAGASIVRIVGRGCGGLLEGSGFVAAPGLVVTNAHVVAGIAHPVVEDRRGRHPAAPVLFDPALDLAVLRAGDLAGPPLALETAIVSRGTAGAVLGYPGGGAFRAGPAAVRRSTVAVGRDIYGGGVTTRTVYELEAVVRPGNSGGPVVVPDGRVIGVVFSRSVGQPDVGYALVGGDVAPRLRRAAASSASVGTGSCAAA